MVRVAWMCARLWLVWRWSWHAWHKRSDPRWVGANAGTSVRNFLNRAIERANSKDARVHPLYAKAARDLFLPRARTLSYLILATEALLPFGLLIPRLARFSAVIGALLNLVFMGGGGDPRDNRNMLVAQLMVLILPADKSRSSRPQTQ